MREEREQAFYEALGHIIKVMRTDLALDRKDLADRADISYSYLAAIENGHKRPSSQVLLAIAEALGLSTGRLFETAEQRVRGDRTQTYPGWLAGEARAAAAPAPQPVNYTRTAPPSRDEFTDELTTLTEELDDSDRTVLLDLARKLAGR